MALKVTEFDRSIKHRIILNDDCGVTVSTNVAGGPCTLKSIIFDNIQGKTVNYVRCANGTSSTIAADEILVSVPCSSRTKSTIEFPDGIPFDRGISFWCSSDADPSGTDIPTMTTNTGKVTVTLVVA